jgi:hypothetical protein
MNLNILQRREICLGSAGTISGICYVVSDFLAYYITSLNDIVQDITRSLCTSCLWAKGF